MKADGKGDVLGCFPFAFIVLFFFTTAVSLGLEMIDNSIDFKLYIYLFICSELSFGSDFLFVLFFGFILGILYMMPAFSLVP